MFACVPHHGLRRRLSGQGGAGGTQGFGQFQVAQNVAPLGFGQALQRRGFHIHRMPGRVAARRSAAGRAQQFVCAGFTAHAHQQSVADLPNLALRHAHVLAAVAAHVVVNAVGGAAQRQFTQRHQIAFAKKILHRRRRLLGHVDLALFQTAQQVVGGQVDEHHLVGGVKHMVGNGLPNAYAGDAAHHIVQAFEVLHVDGGQHIDTDFKQLFDVLPTLGVAAARGVAVGQFIDQQHGRLAGQRGVEVELFDRLAFDLKHAQRQDFQALQLLQRFLSAVVLDDAHHHVHTLLAQALRGFQHGVGFSDTCRRTEKNLQLAARCLGFGRLRARQQFVGVGARNLVGHQRTLASW